MQHSLLKDTFVSFGLNDDENGGTVNYVTKSGTAKYNNVLKEMTI